MRIRAQIEACAPAIEAAGRANNAQLDTLTDIVRAALGWKHHSFKRQVGKQFPVTARLLASLCRARDGVAEPKAKAPKAAKPPKAKRGSTGYEVYVAPAPKALTRVALGVALTDAEIALITAFRAAQQ